MASPVRTSSALSGSFASPASVAAAGTTTTTTLNLTTNAPSTPPITGEIVVVLIIGGTPPTTAPTVQFREYCDGTNPETITTYVCPNAAGTRYPYAYTPSSDAVQKLDAVITNGATTAITQYAVANVMQV
jgi:hypothetical protein